MVTNVNMFKQVKDSPGHAGSRLLALAIAACVVPWPGAAGAGADTAKAPADAIVQQLMTRDLIGSPGKEVLMVTVEYLAGGASLPHRHNAQVFVYVLEGNVRMQVEGAPAVTLGAGQTFYESPADIHTISANASRTKSARLLVFIVKDKRAPVSTDAGPASHP
jgi:quercetin dioxygenase-like cupin family protein